LLGLCPFINRVLQRSPSAPSSDSRGDLRLAQGLPSRPSTTPRVSASLEGSEPTLERDETSLPRSGPPLDIRDKRHFRSPAHHTEALNVNHSSTAPRTDGVRLPFPTVAVTGVPSANSGHCSAIRMLWQHCGTCDAGRDVLGRAPITILPTLAVRTPPHHTYGPGPAPCSGRGPASPRAPQGRMLSTSSRRPGTSPSRGPGPPRNPRTSLVHTPALRPGGSGIATCPVTAGTRIYVKP
jgi:hypothetical protein